MTTPAIREEWRQEILANVEYVPKVGGPGTMVVFGDNAEPILTGNTPKDVVLAVAELGQGRMAVITHDIYTKNWFLQDQIPGNAEMLCKNLLCWLSKGKYDKEWTVTQMRTRSLKEANPIDTILVWQSPKPSDVNRVDDLKTFVKNGGSVIIGVTPWGAVQVHRCEIDDISCYDFLREVQIYLTDGFSKISSDEISVAENKAKFAHVGHLLAKCKTGEMKISDLNVEIIAELGAIPDEDCRVVLKDHINKTDILNMCTPPHPKKPLITNEERAAALFVNLVLKKSGMKAPGIEEFPGDFDEMPLTSCVESKVESTCSEAHPIGGYLAPGGTAKIEVVEGDPDGWKVQVGCHTDNLRSKNKFKRWPDIVVRKKLEPEGQTQVQNPFGGSIYLLSPKESSSLSVRISGDIVESPMFHLDDDAEKWVVKRSSPGLWADLVGEHIMITVPSKSIRNIEHPLEVMKFWDKLVVAYHDLKGVKLTDKRHQWFVPDLQPGAGYMHSGYPIVTHLDAADPKEKMFIVKKPKYVVDGHWGYFHELGHNMQDGRWTFQGTGEVTCNIFAFYGMQQLFDIQPWKHQWLEQHKDSMKSYLKKGADFTEWKGHAGIAVGIYAQLARDFGFDVYKQVFRQYESERPRLNNNQEKIDHWVETFSKAANANIAPAFKMWGIPVSEATIEDLSELKEYLPKDEVTEVIMPTDTVIENVELKLPGEGGNEGNDAIIEEIVSFPSATKEDTSTRDENNENTSGGTEAPSELSVTVSLAGGNDSNENEPGSTASGDSTILTIQTSESTNPNAPTDPATEEPTELSATVSPAGGHSDENEPGSTASGDSTLLTTQTSESTNPNTLTDSATEEPTELSVTVSPAGSNDSNGSSTNAGATTTESVTSPHEEGGDEDGAIIEETVSFSSPAKEDTTAGDDNTSGETDQPTELSVTTSAVGVDDSNGTSANSELPQADNGSLPNEPGSTASGDSTLLTTQTSESTNPSGTPTDTFAESESDVPASDPATSTTDPASDSILTQADSIDHAVAPSNSGATPADAAAESEDSVATAPDDLVSTPTHPAQTTGEGNSSVADLTTVVDDSARANSNLTSTDQIVEPAETAAAQIDPIGTPTDPTNSLADPANAPTDPIDIPSDSAHTNANTAETSQQNDTSDIQDDTSPASTDPATDQKDPVTEPVVSADTQIDSTSTPADPIGPPTEPAGAPNDPASTPADSVSAPADTAAIQDS